MGKGAWIGGGVALVVAGVLGWAWHDGGQRPLSELEAPALLPRIAS